MSYHSHKSPLHGLKSQHALVVFDNPGALVEALKGTKASSTMREQMTNTDDDFYGRLTWEATMKGMVEGNKEGAEKAQRLMASLNTVSHDTKKRQIISSPYGRVSVGAYLASDPMPCRRSVEMPSNRAPLSLVVSLNSIGTVKTADLEQRGVVIAALVRKLVSSRPVNLYLSRASDCGMVTSVMLCKFPTTPVDTFRLAFLLSSQAFCRGVGFAFHQNAKQWYKDAGMICKDVSDDLYIGFAGSTKYSQTRLCEYQRDLRKFLNEEILYIPGSDPENPDFRAMTKDPVKWINETMAELTKH